MDSKKIAIIVIFAALTIALNLSPFKIPAPYAPFLYYQIWEIPIVTAFLLDGPMTGIAVSVINTIALFIYFPGALPTGPLYNLAAILGMLLGVYIVHRFVAGRLSVEREREVSISSTALGVISRVGVMTVVNWAFLKYPYPIGFSIPVEALIVILPIIGFFNATLALYTIPVGYLLARAISSSMGIKRWS